MSSDDLLILALAERRGLIEPETASGEPAEARIERLVREGKLGRGAVSDLARELAAGVGDAPTESPIHADSPRLPDLATRRYHLVELLGSGGMGRVYRAHDLRLDRQVALKILNGDGDGGRALREAHAQARVEHPHICKVFEVGDEGASSFISMQLVTGPPLREAVRDMALEQRVRVAIDVAHAVHEAHKHGLIHRDLKPGNILVEHRPETGWHAYVSDFGLAVDLATQSLVTGQVAGTPHFMAPEQARGSSAIDRRTDVYGLGATIYVLLSGELPFAGSTAEVLAKVLDAPPRPLRAAAPALPRDLCTIVETCLEKEPDRRYDSARALAEDLERFLDGRPILARPPSLAYRARKLVARHRALSLVAAAALAGMALLGGLLVRARVLAGARAAAGERFGHEVAGVEQLMRNAHTMPLHDVRREQALVRRRLEALAEQEEATDLRGPRELALGRGALALHELDAARAHLEAAGAAGADGPDLAAALGQTLGLLAAEQQARAERIEDRGAREAETARVRATLREPALRWLAAAGGEPALAAGMAALLEGRNREAVEVAGRALAASPWLYEAHKLAGDAHLADARLRERAGDEPGATAALERAGAEYAAALEVGRSDPELHDAECDRLYLVARVAEAHGRPPLGAGAQAVAACDRAIVADPAQLRPYLDEIDALTVVADYQAGHWNDPTPELDGADRRATQALALAPWRADPWLARAQIHDVRAERLRLSGKDPRPDLAQSIADLQVAALIDPGFAEVHLELGRALAALATAESRRGGAPEAMRVRAVASLRRFQELEPNGTAGLLALGEIAIQAARHASRQLVPWRPLYAEAIAQVSEATRRDPGSYAVWERMGIVHLYAGLIETDDEAQQRTFDQAAAALRRAVELGPDEPKPRMMLATVHLTRGQALYARSRTPIADFTAAIASLEQIVARNPRDAIAQQNLGTAHIWRAQYRSQVDGVDPGPELDEGLVSLRVALSIMPDASDMLMQIGQAEWTRAGWQAHHGGDPRPALGRAAAAAGEGLRLRPDETDLLWLESAVHEVRAEWLVAHHQPVADELDAGLAAATRALAQRPTHAAAAFAVAGLRIAAMRATPDRAHARAALEAVDAALALSPGWEAQLAPGRAQARELLAR